METIRLGGLFDTDSKHQAGSVWDLDGLSPTLDTMRGGYREPMIVEQKCITTKGKENEVASTILAGYERTNMTGFNADNAVVESVKTEPKLIGGFGEKKSNGGTQYYQQDRVYSMEGVAMCHPSQIPDGSYKYMEIKRVGQISNDGSQYGTVISENGLSSTLSAGTHGYANNCIQQQYRIRKLTPLECWRLMDFTDEDFYKAAEVNSNTQLYKQAGNSIIRNVLVAILGQMIPGKENIYKEME